MISQCRYPLTHHHSAMTPANMSGGSDRADERVTKDAWMIQLMTQHVGRADMNKLIMNYLVTGVYQGYVIPHNADLFDICRN